MNRRNLRTTIDMGRGGIQNDCCIDRATDPDQAARHRTADTDHACRIGRIDVYFISRDDAVLADIGIGVGLDDLDPECPCHPGHATSAADGAGNQVLFRRRTD